jgi:hypothetical protein
MKDPNFGVRFHPQFSLPSLMGRNANNTEAYIHSQMCPGCKEPIVGLK